MGTSEQSGTFLELVHSGASAIARTVRPHGRLPVVGAAISVVCLAATATPGCASRQNGPQDDLDKSEQYFRDCRAQEAEGNACACWRLFLKRFPDAPIGQKTYAESAVQSPSCSKPATDVVDAAPADGEIVEKKQKPATQSVPRGCGQEDDSADYGPIDVGVKVRLQRHTEVGGGGSNWSDTMDRYVGQEAEVMSLRGTDQDGCPGVTVDLDNGRHFWRIRDMVVEEKACGASCGRIADDKACANNFKPTGDDARDLKHLTDLCGSPTGMTPMTPPIRREGAEGPPIEAMLQLRRDHCYRVFVTGGVGIEDLDADVRDTDGDQMSVDARMDDYAVLGVERAICPPVDGAYKVRIVIADGEGQYSWQAWRRPRDCCRE